MGLGESLMSYRLEITLQGCPKNPMNGSHGHWRSANSIRHKWKEMVRAAIANKLPPAPLEKAEITLIRNGSGLLDYDGLVASMKPVVDGLLPIYEKISLGGKRWKRGRAIWSGVIIDDSWSVTGDWRVKQFKVPKGQESTTIIITERT